MGDQYRMNANGDVVTPVEMYGSNIQLPVDVQSRLQTTIQTHNAVSVALSGNSTQATWIDCNGFSSLSVTQMTDASVASYANVLWSNDGSVQHGADYNVTPNNSNSSKSGNVPVKARYAKVQLFNGDTATAHTMNAWAYLMV